MNERDLAQLLVFLGALVALTPLLGRFIAHVFAGERTLLSRMLGPIEQTIYRLGGVDPLRETSWGVYAGALLAFNVLGIIALLALQTAQGGLPLNPAKMPGVPFALAFNTAVSFVTNTNWQAYSGENTMSYLTQMSGLTVQNFVHARLFTERRERRGLGVAKETGRRPLHGHTP